MSEMIHSECSDVIVCQETKVNETIYSFELFPDNYEVLCFLETEMSAVVVFV